jgi:hypothetical protein
MRLKDGESGRAETRPGAARPDYAEGETEGTQGWEAPMAVGQGYPAAGGERGQMRAADSDRDRAVGFLTTAYTEGRLTKD